MATRRDGFEIGLHVNTDCADFTPATLEDYYTSQLLDFATEYPSLPAPTTNRTHCIAWSDWATTPKVELAQRHPPRHQLLLLAAGLGADGPGMFTGSGMPMRFADTDGTLIDVYQATTQMTDESDQSYPFTVDTLLDRRSGRRATTARSREHAHRRATPSGADAIVASAGGGVPGEQMLTWLDGRNGSTFGSINWNNGTPHLQRRRRPPGRPDSSACSRSARRPDAQLDHARRHRRELHHPDHQGREYALFTATGGSYAATYAVDGPPPDTTPPTISTVSATANTNGTATVSWTTNEAPNTRVDYGTAPDNLNLNASDAAMVTSHSIQLTGLTPGATYHYRVSSADAAGNAAQSPASPAALANFPCRR